MNDDVIKLLNLRKTKIIKVTFIKKNGDVRIMRCTTNSVYIPEDKMPHQNIVYNDNQIRVFDVDKRQWRSFLIENLRNVEVEDESDQ